MKSMYIGSGDVGALLADKTCEAHRNLLRRFVSNTLPFYHAENSPIDALRTGAILESRYLSILPDDYYPQYSVISPCMNVFKCTLDFAKLQDGKVTDFDELKTCNFDDFLLLEEIKDAEYNEQITFLKKHYKRYYNQVQEQLFCTDLHEASLIFLVVYTYDDQKNRSREIQENEYIRFRIKRDETVIDEIKQKGMPFQVLKDFYCNDL